MAGAAKELEGEILLEREKGGLYPPVPIGDESRTNQGMKEGVSLDGRIAKGDFTMGLRACRSWRGGGEVRVYQKNFHNGGKRPTTREEAPLEGKATEKALLRRDLRRVWTVS